MQVPDGIKRLIEGFRRSKPGQFLQVYSERDVSTWAVVVAYSIMFAMFPILLALLAIAGFVLRSEDAFDQVVQQVSVAFPAGGGEQIVQALQGTRQGAGALGIVSFVGLLWSGSALFGALSRGFNRIYQVEDRGIIQQRLMGAAMIFVFAAFLVLSLSVSSIAFFASDIVGQIPAIGNAIGPTVATVIPIVLLLALAGGFFTLLYWQTPNRRLPIRQVLPGTAVGALGFVLISQIFPLYGAYFANFNQYGALFGLFFLLMTWFWLLAQIIFAGAVLNVVLFPETAGEQPQEPAKGREPMQQAA